MDESKNRCDSAYSELTIADDHKPWNYVLKPTSKDKEIEDWVRDTASKVTEKDDAKNYKKYQAYMKLPPGSEASITTPNVTPPQGAAKVEVEAPATIQSEAAETIEDMTSEPEGSPDKTINGQK